MHQTPSENASEPPAVYRLVKDDELRAAFSAQQLEMLFRPRIHCRTGTLEGFEVLPRWYHPQAGRIEAQELLEMAEARGLVAELASEMVEQSLAWLHRWRGSAPHEPLGSRVLESIRLTLPHGLTVTAAGVEDQSTMDRLHELGYSRAEGELVPPPLVGTEVLEWFRRREGHREAQRLEALEATGLLDPSGEERFDRLTRLAQHLLEVPITLISLVDRDRQWFKSRQGLEIAETPRDVAFCHSTIQQDELMEVPDARRDERFSKNPLVTGPPYIRFYAGHPLCLATGEKVGSLCVIETQPRRLDEHEKELLSYLALQVEEELAARLPDTRANAVGLLDESMFLSRATSAFSLCRRFGFNTVLVKMCMTNIPWIQQLHGDAVGEDLITQLGDVIVEAANPAELVGRHGNDVVAMLMEVTLGEVRALCRELEIAILAWNARLPLGLPRTCCHIEVTSATFDEQDAFQGIWNGPWTRYATVG